ncbi:MAG: thioredoxin family protein [Sandaracinus sp.]|nr:thioredoxin family protein [Sandaracinus sp.]MCB9618219.1 thioredoxin family protein [Sandaracinus sp.]MCB9625397.1 thioredoxin family protein [Sandaracinus sp.]MCB9636228.1 thioredoxin family protein [Sandaracinus sp.]
MHRALCVIWIVLAGCGESETAPAVLAPEAADLGESNEPAAPTSETPPEVARPYEDGADAGPLLETALAEARAENKRVLLMFGANWCVWCRRLEWVFQNDADVSTALREGWKVVHVDVGAGDSGTNAATIARYGNPVQHGLPCLVVLDAQGQPVHTQETGSLEVGNRHDPARVVAFLNRFRAPG